MEKSIEKIWKEGFLTSDALIAPKINKLYSKKSAHLIDKFKRMFKINLIAIIIFSFVFLIVSYLVGIPITGIIFFCALSFLVVINNQLLKSLNAIDKGVNSYEYLKAFNDWVQMQIRINQRISSFLYPIIFISLVLGFWFKDEDGIYLGELLLTEFLVHFPDLYLLYGIPLLAYFVVLVIVGILAVFGSQIYLWDMKLIYGTVFKKLKGLLADVENLHNE